MKRETGASEQVIESEREREREERGERERSAVQKTFDQFNKSVQHNITYFARLF